jgi:hypothetical protein
MDKMVNRCHDVVTLMLIIAEAVGLGVLRSPSSR